MEEAINREPNNTGMRSIYVPCAENDLGKSEDLKPSDAKLWIVSDTHLRGCQQTIQGQGRNERSHDSEVERESLKEGLGSPSGGLLLWQQTQNQEHCVKTQWANLALDGKPRQGAALRLAGAWVQQDIQASFPVGWKVCVFARAVGRDSRWTYQHLWTCTRQQILQHHRPKSSLRLRGTLELRSH